MIRKVLLSFLSLICIFNLSLGTVFAEGEPEPSPEPTPEVSAWVQLVNAAADPDNTQTNEVLEVTGDPGNRTIKLLQDITASTDDTPIVIAGGVTLTIDLNGHILDRNAVNKETGAATAATGKRIITNNGTLTVTSSDTTTQHAGKIVGKAWIPGSGEKVLSGGVLCGGSGNETGGVIYSYNKNCLTLSNINIAGNNCTGSAGVYIGSCANITDCSFIYNYAYNGGAIYSNITSDPSIDTDYINISGCTFDHNYAAVPNGSGGAIYRDRGRYVITNSTFSNNQAYWGGAISSDYEPAADTTTITNCIFTGNSAIQGGSGHKNKGGAIFACTNYTIDQCTFTNNYLYNCSWNTQIGGGIYLAHGGTATITDSTFSNNRAPKGGAIGTDESGVEYLYIRGCTFNGANNAIMGGSAIYGHGSVIHIYSGDFSGNVSQNLNGYGVDWGTGIVSIRGGSLYLEADPGKEIKIAGNQITSSAESEYTRGGVSVDGGGKVYLSGKVTINNNGNAYYGTNAQDNGIKIASGELYITGDITDSSIRLNMPATNEIHNPNDIDLNDINLWMKPSGGRDGYIEPSGQLVVNPTDGHLITVIVNEGSGKILTNYEETKVMEGDVVELTPKPNGGYEFVSLSVADASGSEITVTDNKFTMPNTNVFVYAQFKALPRHDDGPSEVVEEEPEKKFIIQTAPKKEEKKEEPKDFGIKIDDGNLKINFHPKTKTSITITNLDALKAMSDRIVSDLKYYKESGNAPLYIDDLDKETMLEIIENNDEITLEPYYSFDDEKYVINEDTDRMNDFVSKITDRHDGKTIFSLELGINIMANGKKIGSINEVSQPLEYKIQLDSDAFKDSKDRYLYLVTYHKGEYSYRPLQIDGSGSVVFTSQQFSPFRVISTKTSLLVNSTSVDYVLGLFFVGALLLVALITVLIIRNKKKRYYNSQVLVNQNIKF